MLHCDDCDFDYELSLASKVSELAPVCAAEYAGLLDEPAEQLRTRTRPDVWAPLEYACHVRDVMLVQRERLLAARRTDNPVAEPMGREERAEHDGYATQDPSDVARQLTDATAMFTRVLDRLGPEDWDRTLTVPYPEPAERTVRWFAVHTLHELRHHLHDIRRQLSS